MTLGRLQYEGLDWATAPIINIELREGALFFDADITDWPEDETLPPNLVLQVSDSNGRTVIRQRIADGRVLPLPIGRLKHKHWVRTLHQGIGFG